MTILLIRSRIPTPASRRPGNRANFLASRSRHSASCRYIATVAHPSSTKSDTSRVRLAVSAMTRSRWRARHRRSSALSSASVTSCWRASLRMQAPSLASVMVMLPPDFPRKDRHGRAAACSSNAVGLTPSIAMSTTFLCRWSKAPNQCPLGGALGTFGRSSQSAISSSSDLLCAGRIRRTPGGHFHSQRRLDLSSDAIRPRAINLRGDLRRGTGPSRPLDLPLDYETNDGV